MLRKIKSYFKRRAFSKRCPFIPCPNCPYYLDSVGKCYLAVCLGLEEV